MEHETVLRPEIEKMGRPVLVVRVPAKESADLRAVRSFVMDSLALGVLVVGQGVGLSLEYLPKLGGVACTWSDPWVDDGLAGKPVTDELIRELITEGKKIPMEVWRQIGAALDALEQEDGHE